MLLYAQAGYSAALSMCWGMQGHTLSFQWEGSSLHHREGCKKRQRGEFSPNFALAPTTAFSFFLFFLHKLVWSLHGIWANSGKNFCLCNIIICLIQVKAWLSTVLVHSSSDWYKMVMLYLGTFIFSQHISIIKVTFKRKVSYYETCIEYLLYMDI